MSETFYSSDFNSTFFLSVGTLVITAFSVCLGFALKSKCSNVKICCGCLEITRDIGAELDEAEMGQISPHPVTIEETVGHLSGRTPRVQSPTSSRRNSRVPNLDMSAI